MSCGCRGDGRTAPLLGHGLRPAIRHGICAAGSLGTSDTRRPAPGIWIKIMPALWTACIIADASHCRAPSVGSPIAACVLCSNATALRGLTPVAPMTDGEYSGPSPDPEWRLVHRLLTLLPHCRPRSSGKTENRERFVVPRENACILLTERVHWAVGLRRKPHSKNDPHRAVVQNFPPFLRNQNHEPIDPLS